MMNARQRLMSIALTIPDTAALLEAVAMLSESETLVSKLWSNVDYLRKGFTELGFDIGHSETPIIPVSCPRACLEPSSNLACSHTPRCGLCAGDAGRRGVREGLQREALRARRLRFAHRLPDGTQRLVLEPWTGGGPRRSCLTFEPAPPCGQVARGAARVRVIVSASFSQADCDVGLKAFKKVQAELAK